MISVEAALQRLLAPLKPLAAEQIAVSDGLGRVLAEDIVSRRTQPPFAVSAMDGYAVRAADVATVPARLRVVGAAPAGSAFPGTVGAGETVRIFTGAPVPAGADCIVIQEDTSRDGDWVTVDEGAPRPWHRGRQGPDRPRYRPRRGDEPAMAPRPSPPAHRRPAHRR